MKCPKCSGAGYIYNNLVGYAEDCSVCHGTGEVQTNEEWLKSMNTEQLAEFLGNVGFENETIVRKFKSEWVEWLKQPYTNKG